MHIIGLGKAGCNIAKIFSKFPQYHTIGIDTDENSDIKINEEALSCLDALRSNLGHSIRLSSAYRSPYHNAKVGGAPKSSHLEGYAFDVQLQGRDKEVIRKVAQDCGFKGFGMRYQTFIHIDMGRRRQW